MGTVGLDQLTKEVAKQTLAHTPPIIYLFDLFRFQYAENRGAFLSLGAGLSEEARFWILTLGVALCLVLATGYFVIHLHKLSLFTAVGAALTIGGGVGNLIDRFLFGHVVDFMNMGIGSLRTGIFNIADLGIVFGGLMLAFSNFDFSAKKGQPQKELPQ